MPCKNKANVLHLSLNNTSICLKRVTNGIKPVHDTFTSTKTVRRHWQFSGRVCATVFWEIALAVGFEEEKVIFTSKNVSITAIFLPLFYMQ